MVILKLLMLSFCILASWLTMAAPPVNLSDVGGREEEDLKKMKNIRNLKQGDLTFTEDHAQFNIKIPKDAARVVFDVKGRSLPNRTGRILFSLQEGEFIKKLKPSRDQKWLMIQTFEAQPRRAWVPLTSVKIPDQRVPASKAPAVPVPKP